MLSTIPLPVLHQARKELDTTNGQDFTDPFGRGVGYLRLSLTSAGSMRCTYCRPRTNRNPRHEQRLSPDEIGELVSHLSKHHGLHKVRLTGGDPTSRPELVRIIERIAAVPGIEDLAMTTNGLTLERMAKAYRDAGLKRVNVSLDTLDRKRFAVMTGLDGLERVIAGIDQALASGLAPLKLNTVVIRGQNEEHLADLVAFAASRGIEARFIELMPMGPLADQWEDRYVPAPEVRLRLERSMTFIESMEQGHDAAQRFKVVLANGLHATVGFITPMSCNFCQACNRLRLAADGRLYPCLMDRPAGSLLPALRPLFDGVLADRLIREALASKQAEHPMYGDAGGV